MGLPIRTYFLNENAPWLVMVNGLFTGKGSWNDCLAYIEGFNILTYDAKGQGEGPGLSQSYSLDEQVQDLKNLLDEHKLNEVSFFGLSNGGRVALKFSSLYPDRVKSVVACDTYADVTPILKLKLESWLKAHKTGGAKHRFDVAAPWVWGESVLNNNPDLIKKYRDLSEESVPKNITSLIEGALSGTVDLESINTPVCFVVGEEDLLTPINHHKKLKEKVKEAELFIIPGGHASVLEYPSSIKDSILPYLRRQHGLD